MVSEWNTPKSGYEIARNLNENMFTAPISTKKLIVLPCHITLWSTKRMICCLLKSEAHMTCSVGGSWDSWLKAIAQFQNSGVSQEGTLFSCFNHPKKHPRALEGKLVLTQRKAGYLAHVRDRHMTLIDFESLVHSTCLSSTWPTDISGVPDLLILEIKLTVR